MTSRGRPTKPVTEPLPDTFDPEKIAAEAAKAGEMALIEQAVSAEQIDFSDFVGRLRGRREMAEMASKVVTVTELLALQQLKNSKAYRGKRVVGLDGKLVPVTTFEEFCLHGLGRSREAVDRDLLNLKTLGAETVDALQQMGLGAGKLRDLRAVPEADRAQVLQIAQSGDKDAVVDLVETLIHKHQREQAQAAKAADDLKSQLDARQRLLDKERAEHQALKDAAELRENPPLPEAEARQLAELRDAAMGAELALQRVLARVDEVMSEPATEAVELAARQTLDYVAQRLLVGAAERGIALCFEGDVDPIYMQQLREQLAAAQAERAAQHKPRRGRQ